MPFFQFPGRSGCGEIPNRPDAPDDPSLSHTLHGNSDDVGSDRCDGKCGAKTEIPATQESLQIGPGTGGKDAPLHVRVLHSRAFPARGYSGNQIALAGTLTDAATRARRTASMGSNSDEGTDSK